MPRNRKKCPPNSANHKRRQHHALISGDQLFTRKVTLVDAIELVGSPIAGNGVQRLFCSSNGVSTPDVTTPVLP